MFCSTIIPTIARPSLVRAVRSVLEQQIMGAEFEVIVVNDSGRPLPPAAWQREEQVRVIDTNRRERSVARNTGAAVARGEYLYFLDDDDWLLPGTLERFWRLAQRDGDAVWLYGGVQVIDTSGRCLAEINSGLSGNSFAQIVGGAWVPIQVSLIQTKAFFAAGGFDPLICGTEDLDLCRRIALRGDFANVPVAVGCLLRDVNWGSSTDYVRGIEDNRRSRDRLLDQPGAFARLQASARSSYWHGRVVHVYISAILLNLRRGRLLTAVSRSIFCLMAFVLAGSCIFSASFWRAVKADQVPNSLYDVLLALEQEPRKQKNEAS